MNPAASASPAPVESTAVTGTAARSSPSTTIPRGPRLTTRIAVATSPIASHSRSLPSTTCGFTSASASRMLEPRRRTCVHDERSTLTRAPCSCANAPSAVAQAATFAACPPGASVVLATASSPEARRVSSRTITSRSRSPRVQTSTVRLSRGRGGQAERASAVLHVRRAARRVGGRRGRSQTPPDALAVPQHARRAGRLRGRAVLRRDAREGSRSRTSLARAARVESAESQRALDREQVDVRVAEVERLPHELNRLRLEQELPDRAGRLATADDEEGAEDAGLELRRRPRVAQRDVQSRIEVVVVARVQDPHAAPERRRLLVEHVQRELRVRAWHDRLRERAVLLPRTEKQRVVAEEDVARPARRREPKRRRFARGRTERRLADVERARVVHSPGDLAGAERDERDGHDAD